MSHIPNRLEYMAKIRDVLELDQDDLPDYSTIYKSFDRLKMWVWRALLRVPCERLAGIGSSVNALVKHIGVSKIFT